MKTKITALAVSSILATTAHASNIGDVDVMGEVHFDATSSEAFNGDVESDTSLYRADLGMKTKVARGVNGNLLFRYEDGSDIKVNEALVEFSLVSHVNEDNQGPLYLRAGRTVVPFGSLRTNLVTDPLTLSLAETTEDTAIIGFYRGGLNGQAYLFSGDITEAGKKKLNGFGFTVGFDSEQSADGSVSGGLSYISKFADSDKITSAIEANSGGTDISNSPAGVSLHGAYDAGKFSLIVEYITALDKTDVSGLDFKGDGAQPAASNMEFAYRYNGGGNPTIVSVGYQTTAEASGLSLPESRIAFAYTTEFMPEVSLGLEYSVNEDYSVSDGGTGENGYTATARLSTTF